MGRDSIIPLLTVCVFVGGGGGGRGLAFKQVVEFSEGTAPQNVSTGNCTSSLVLLPDPLCSTDGMDDIITHAHVFPKLASVRY